MYTVLVSANAAMKAQHACKRNMCLTDDLFERVQCIVVQFG